MTTKETDLNRSKNLPEGRVAVLTLSVGAGGAESSRIFRLHKDRVVIGSMDSADIRLLGEGVSPFHAVLEIGEETPGLPSSTIYDLASDTGTYVNGEKVVTRRVKTGDEITIGRNRLRFSTDEKSSSISNERTRIAVNGRKLYLDPSEDLAPLLLEDGGDIIEIFDYSRSSNLALEAVLSWHGTILDVSHFADFKQVVIGGDQSCDFAIPPVATAARYPILQKQGNDTYLNFDPSMTGVVQRQGEIMSLDQARNQAGPSAFGAQIRFGTKDFAKVKVGELDFYFSFTDAPPRLKRRRMIERDPFFFRVLSSSLLFTGLLIAAIFRVQVSPLVEIEEVPERIATILYQPEKFTPKPKPPAPPEPKVEAKEEPKVEVKPVEPPKKPEITKLEIQPKNPEKPKPIPKELTGAKSTTEAAKNPAPVPKKGPGRLEQSQAKEGEGARAKGAEGTRGAKNAPKVEGVDPQTAAARKSANGGVGRGGGASQVNDNANVDMLKGAGSKIMNILGGSAALLGSGGKKLEGFGGFTTQGGGGLALSGDGKGGGGTADSLGGLGTKGQGGGRVGTGLGAAGTGNGIIGGQTRVSIRTGGPEEAVVMGAIDADAVEAALLAHKDEFRYCYEKEINAENPSLSGRVSTSFVIGSSGRVAQAGIEATTLKNANVERCVIGVIKRIDFPIPRGGGLVQVTYPFKFNAQGG